MNQKRSIYLKGLAILLMIVNHIFPLHNLIFDGNEYIGVIIKGYLLEDILGGFAKICVALFAFLTGVGLLYFLKVQSIYDLLRKIVKKIGTLYSIYWMILILLFVPAGMVFNTSVINGKQALGNILGTSTSWNMPAWYLLVYAEILLSLSVLLYVSEKWVKLNTTVCMVAYFILINICKRSGTAEYVDYCSIALCGYLCAKYNLFEVYLKWAKKNNVLSISVSCVLLGVCFAGRIAAKQISGFSLDTVYTVLLVLSGSHLLALLEISQTEISKKILYVLSVFGNKSTYIWLSHGIIFFVNESVQKLVYWPKFSGLVLINACVLFLVLGCVVEKLYKARIKAVEFMYDKLESNLMYDRTLNNSLIVDVLRYILSILVVAIHTAPLISIHPTLNSFFVNEICRIAVPLFFIMNGFFFFRKENTSERELIKFIRKNIIIYVLLVIVYIPFGCKVLGGFEEYFIVSLTKGYAHLWYLYSLIIGFPIAYVFVKVCKKKTFVVSICLYLAGAISNDIYHKVPIVGTLVHFDLIRHTLFMAVPFVMLGAVLTSVRIKRIWYGVAATIAFTGFLTIENLILATTDYALGFENNICMYFVVALIFLTILSVGKNIRCEKCDGKFLRRISSLVYYLHGIPIVLIHGKINNSVFYFVTVYIFSFILSLLIDLTIRNVGNRV